MRSLVAASLLLVTVACTTATGRPSNKAVANDAGPANDASASRQGLVVLASGQTQPWAVAVDDQNVYWTNSGSHGGLYKVPKVGGSPVPLYEGPMGSVESMALDSTYLYLPIEPEDRIVAAPIAGGELKTIASSNPTSAVALANGDLYWVEGSAGLNAPAVAKKVSVGGGDVTEIALPEGPTGRPTSSHSAIATTEAVYASFEAGGGIVRIALDGSPAVRIASGFARGLGADTDRIYFATDDAVNAIPKAGGSSSFLAAVPNPIGLANDDAFVYFSDVSPSGRILKVSKSGGTAASLAGEQGAPHGIAVDATHVYWSCIDEGTIKKIAK